jgi:branched-chain amino acid transport system substrate-binding protein
MKTSLSRTATALGLLSLIGFASAPAVSADEVCMPIVMPITGFLSVEGASQRNGAVMAIEDASKDVKIKYEIFDTGTSATGAATALERALNSCEAVAVPSTVFGTEMVAMAPIAQEYKVPLLTISGLTKLTHSGNPYIFRFLPNDGEIKVAQVRYAVEELGRKKPALITDNTAYGQGGRGHMEEILAKLGVPITYQEEIAFNQHDMSPLVDKIKRSSARHVAAGRQDQTFGRGRDLPPHGLPPDGPDR